MKEHEFLKIYYEIPAPILNSLGWERSYNHNKADKQDSIRDLFEFVIGLETVDDKTENCLEAIEDEIERSLSSAESDILYEIGKLRRFLSERKKA
tara:strand:+ start:2207 stop:2491 length:285 start_codon:yes stop_codon:yes gene_type:complete